MSRDADNTRRLQKTTECCGRAGKCIKESLMTHPDDWGYWYAA